MSPVVTTATAADFLALVPHLMGFEAQNSIVFVAFRGRRTCGAMRFDLPVLVESAADDAGSKFYKRVATTLVGTVSKLSGVDGVVPVVYTDETFAGSSGMPRAAFVRAVIARFEFSGFDVRDALCIAADGWGSYFDPKCPPQGRALSDIADSRVLDGVPVDDVRPLGDIAQWSTLPEASEHERQHVEKSLRTFARVFDSRVLVDAGEIEDDEDDDWLYDHGFDDDELYNDELYDDDLSDDDYWDARRRTVSRLVREVPAQLERILARGGAGLDVDRANWGDSAAFVISLARLPALRDVVMLQWAFDLDTGERVLSDARRFVFGAPADELGSAGLMLGQGPRPDPERIERAIELLKKITSLAPESHRPPLFCILAWLNWALGRSSVANVFVTAAEEIDAHYGFAELMRAVLERGMLPEWAFATEP